MGRTLVALNVSPDWFAYHTEAVVVMGNGRRLFRGGTGSKEAPSDRVTTVVVVPRYDTGIDQR